MIMHRLLFLLALAMILTHLVESLSASSKREVRLSRLYPWQASSIEEELGWCLERRDKQQDDDDSDKMQTVALGWGPYHEEATMTTWKLPDCRHGSIGTSIWASAVACSILWSSPQFANTTAGKHPRILELGCGLGLSGLVAAASAYASQLVLTDHDDEVMELLSRQVLPWNHPQHVASDTHLQTKQLDWRDDDKADASSTFDIIVGSDVAYYFYLLRPLMDTILRHFDQEENDDDQLVVIAGSASRESQWDLYNNIKSGCYNQITDQQDPPWPGTTRMLLYDLEISEWIDDDDDDDDDEELKWLETKALGEKEAQQAIRNGKTTTGPEQQQNTNTTTTTNPLSSPKNSMMQAAEQHAEQARKYLESMLPEFLGAVSSSDSGDAAAAAAAAVSNNKARKQQNNNTNNNRNNNHLRSPKSKTRKQTPRQREELIARVVQENNNNNNNNHGAMASPAISTLGFDNTFDTKSLGDIMDGPSSTTPQSKETLSKMLQHMKSKKKQQEKQTTTTKSSSSSNPTGTQLTSPARRARIEKFVATVVPGEAELLSPADQTKLHEIHQLDQLVDGRLTAAARADDDDDACSLSSYHGVPQHDLSQPDARTNKRGGKTLPQQQPTFIVASLKVQPQLLSARSWEDLADGNASLEEVVEQTHPKETNANANDDDEKENRKKKKGMTRMSKKNEKLTPSSSSNKNKNNNKKKSKLLSPALWLRRRNKNPNNNNNKKQQQPEAAPNPKSSNRQKSNSSTPNTTRKQKVPNDLPRTISITPSNQNAAAQSPPPMFTKPIQKPMTSPDENNEDRYISLTELQEDNYDNDTDDDDEFNHAEAVVSEPDLDRYEVTSKY